MTSTNTLAAALARSPAIKAAVKEADAAEVRRRTAIVQQLQINLEKFEAAHAKALLAESALREQVAKAAGALQHAQDLFYAEHSKTASLVLTHEHTSDRLVRQLVETADPRIHVFITNLLDLHQVVRNAPVPTGGQNNAVPALHAIRAAAEHAEALKLLALSADDIAARLQQIALDLAAPLAAVGVQPPTVATADPLLH
jgi:hypothetical protein